MRAILGLAALLLLAACGPGEPEALPVENRTAQPLRVQVVDRRASGDTRRRTLELPAGQRVVLELRLRPDRDAQVEARTLDGAYHHVRALSAAEVVALRRSGGTIAIGPAELGMLAAAAAMADSLRPIANNLAAGRPAVADETDPAGSPAAAVDGEPRSFWRGLNPPPRIVASWAVDLGQPTTVERLQVDVACVSCGYVKLKVTFLREPLPTLVLAKAGVQQEASLLTEVDRLSSAVVGQLQLEGTVGSGDTLAASPPTPLADVWTVVVSLLDGPENIGLYDVRLGGSHASGR